MLPEKASPETPDEPVKPQEFIDIIHDVKNEERFIDIFDSRPRAMSYIQSVVILYRSDEKLHACTASSIVSSALQSASCELQVTPFYRQAYIIPRPKKIKAHKDPKTNLIVPEYYRTEANFQPHYHGLEVLAHRTNIYRAINVSPIYKGQRVLEDIHTGLHYFTLADAGGTEIELSNGDPMLAMPPRFSQLRDATKGKRPIEDVIGYLAYFETFEGQKRSVWMTIPEIEAHAKKFSDAYTSKYSLWAMDNPHRPVMQMKTAFIQLTKLMDLSMRGHEKLSRAASYGDEAQQAAMEDASLDGNDLIIDNEPRYQTDEFSQDAPTPVTPIIINTPSMTTGGQAQGIPVETHTESRKTAAPLPVAVPVGTLPMSYSRAKAYFLGPKPLESIGTFQLEKELERTTLSDGTRRAIAVVLEWRKKLEEAKQFFLGDKALMDIETPDLETAFQDADVHQVTKDAIKIVLEGRKTSQPTTQAK